MVARGYGTTQSGMSATQRDALVEAGRNAMCVYPDQPSAAPAVSEGMSDLEAGRAKRIADRVATGLLGL